MPCHANKGSYKPTIWTPERNAWLIENTKGLKRQEAYDLFCKAFPEINVTLTALCNQRSRLHCAQYYNPHGSTKKKGLYSEHIKKGYVFIKVAQPSVWWSKAKWVWVETHPGQWDEVEETDSFYFLDGNNLNFAPDNIEKVHRNEQCIIASCGGVVPGRPDLTKLNILRARLKIATFNAAERIPGEIVRAGTTKYRVMRKERNKKARERFKERYHNDPEFRAKVLNHQKEYLKTHPEAYKKKKQNGTEWAKKKREEMKNGKTSK